MYLFYNDNIECMMDYLNENELSYSKFNEDHEIA